MVTVSVLPGRTSISFDCWKTRNTIAQQRRDPAKVRPHYEHVSLERLERRFARSRAFALFA
jgi:hypothetical protein